MILPAVAAVITACAPPGVAVETIIAVVQVESGGQPLVLGINRPGEGGTTIFSPSIPDALATIQESIAGGASVDIGLMQVNTTQAARLGYSFAELLDPCTNIRAGSRMLADAYAAALHVAPAGQAALQVALSAYNTGDFRSGFTNGYVARYYAQRPSGTGPDPYSASPTVYHREEGSHASARQSEPRQGSGRPDR